MKYNTHKIYEAPTLKAFCLDSPMLLTTSDITAAARKASAGDRAESKAFWGSTLFDEEDDEENVGDIVNP